MEKTCFLLSGMGHLKVKKLSRNGKKNNLSNVLYIYYMANSSTLKQERNTIAGCPSEIFIND